MGDPLNRCDWSWELIRACVGEFSVKEGTKYMNIVGENKLKRTW